eukprot:4916089-Ditylum_brightwellii.AAC.1
MTMITAAAMATMTIMAMATTEAKRLRDNPDVGFITIIDILSKEEQEKAARPKCCFEKEEVKLEQDSGEMEYENEEGRGYALIKN